VHSKDLILRLINRVCRDNRCNSIFTPHFKHSGQFLLRIGCGVGVVVSSEICIFTSPLAEGLSSETPAWAHRGF
jgi:hypothetical protein